MIQEKYALLIDEKEQEFLTQGILGLGATFDLFKAVTFDSEKDASEWFDKNHLTIADLLGNEAKNVRIVKIDAKIVVKPPKKLPTLKGDMEVLAETTISLHPQSPCVPVVKLRKITEGLTVVYEVVYGRDGAWDVYTDRDIHESKAFFAAISERMLKEEDL